MTGTELLQTRSRSELVQIGCAKSCHLRLHAFDVVKKQRTLHVHGVAHYWLVDPTHRLLTVLRWEADQYRRVLDAGVGDVVRAEPFTAIDLEVGLVFGAEPQPP